MIAFGRKRRKKKTDFDPNHEFVNSAVQRFLRSGGYIQKVETIDKNYQGFLTGKELVSPADEFLMGV